MPEIGPVDETATVGLLCGDDADPDFQDFINELGRCVNSERMSSI